MAAGLHHRSFRLLHKCLFGVNGDSCTRNVIRNRRLLANLLYAPFPVGPSVSVPHARACRGDLGDFMTHRRFLCVHHLFTFTCFGSDRIFTFPSIKLILGFYQKNDLSPPLASRWGNPPLRPTCTHARHTSRSRPTRRTHAHTTRATRALAHRARRPPTDVSA
jgi:hypothetical protein